MRVIGGNLGLDFVNTRVGPPSGPIEDDLLGSYEDLVAWARHVGSVGEANADQLLRHARRDRRGARAATERAASLRDHIDRVFRAIAHARQPSMASLNALRDQEAHALGRAELVAATAGYHWNWEHDRSLERPLGPVIQDAIELLTNGPLERIKACGGCSFLFVDESKNRSRRWCSMEDCGQAEKVRQFVARRARRRAAVRGSVV